MGLGWGEIARPVSTGKHGPVAWPSGWAWVLWASTSAQAVQIEVKPLKLHTGVEVSALHLSGTMVEGDGDNLDAFLRQPKGFDANRPCG
jgi:hypothetical protein